MIKRPLCLNVSPTCTALIQHVHTNSVFIRTPRAFHSNIRGNESWHQIHEEDRGEDTLFFSDCRPDCNLIVLSTSLFPFVPPLFLSHLSSCPPSSHLSIICHDSEWMKTKRRGIRLHGSSCPACHFLHPHRLCPVLVFRQPHWNEWSRGSRLI